MQATNLGMGEVELAHGPGHADITESTLLFETPRLLQRHLMREQPFFYPSDEDHRKLQPLGRMQRHQLHAIFEFIRLMLAGIECRLGQEGFKRYHALARLGWIKDIPLGEATSSVDQLFQVLHPGLTLFSFLATVMLDQTGGLDPVSDNLM